MRMLTYVLQTSIVPVWCGDALLSGIALHYYYYCDGDSYHYYATWQSLVQSSKRREPALRICNSWSLHTTLGSSQLTREHCIYACLVKLGSFAPSCVQLE